jgi:hypothetical protein
LPRRVQEAVFFQQLSSHQFFHRSSSISRCLSPRLNSVSIRLYSHYDYNSISVMSYIVFQFITENSVSCWQEI